MQKLLIWILIISLSAMLEACNKQSEENANNKRVKQIEQKGSNTEQSSLSVEGEVAQDYYITASESASPYAYKVNIKIKNIGTTGIKYDRIVGGFFPKNGSPLVQKTLPYEGVIRDQKILELVPGAIHKVEFTTNGYTYELLRNSEDAPLQFSILLALNDQRITVPFTADLPPFDDKLPRTERGMIVKSLPLSFRNIEPYKYTPKSAN